MYDTSDFKKGLKILIKEEPYVILDFQHVKPGKGNQFTRTKLKNLLTQSGMELTIRSGEKFKIPDITYKTLSYTYKDAQTCYFMDQTSYETLEVDLALIGKSLYYLTESLEVTSCFFNGKFVSIELPKTLILKVTQTEPGFKGNTVSNTTKSAIMETGLKVQVPLHIEKGDHLKINTTDGNYIEKSNP